MTGSCCLEIDIRFPFAEATENVLVSGSSLVPAHRVHWPSSDSLTRAERRILQSSTVSSSCQRFFSLVKYYVHCVPSRSIRHVQVRRPPRSKEDNQSLRVLGVGQDEPTKCFQIFFVTFVVSRPLKKINPYAIGGLRLSYQSNDNVELLVKFASEHCEGSGLSGIAYNSSTLIVRADRFAPLRGVIAMKCNILPSTADAAISCEPPWPGWHPLVT